MIHTWVGSTGFFSLQGSVLWTSISLKCLQFGVIFLSGEVVKVLLELAVYECLPGPIYLSICIFDFLAALLHAGWEGEVLAALQGTTTALYCTGSLSALSDVLVKGI